MATAKDYAQWIINNPGKRGTPDFEVIAQAYRKARELEQAPAEPMGQTLSEPMEQAPTMEELQQQADVSDIPIIGPDGQTVSQTPPTQPPSPETSVMQDIIGAGEVAASMVTGTAGQLIGVPAGFLLQLGQELESGQFGTQEAAKRIYQAAQEAASGMTYVPRTEAGQRQLQAVGEAAEVIEPVVAPIAGLSGEMQAITSGVKAAAPVVEQATVAGGGAAGRGVERIAERVQRGVAGAREGFQKRLTDIADTLKNDPYNADVIDYRLDRGRAVPDPEAQEAVVQGWEPGEVAVIKAMSNKDKFSALKMLNIYEKGKANKKFRELNRPSQVVGDSILDRVKFVDNERKQAGKDLERVAETQLKGSQVNYAPAIDTFISDLNKIGVKVTLNKKGTAKANLKDSDIQGDEKAENLINATLERLSDVRAPDAYGVHTAKQFIDTQVGWGKKSLGNPLIDKAAFILKTLRMNLNKALGDSFDDYRQANDVYSRTKRALDDFQTAAKIKVDKDSDIANESYGREIRKIMSNYGVREQLIGALDELETVSKSLGKKIDDDIVNQLIFANSLDRMFNTAGSATFKGQISQAVRPGLEAAQRRDVANLAFDLAGKIYEKGRGINEENAIAEIKKLLKRTNNSGEQ